jgi:ABC-type phosphate transport system substrate-binding protein
MFTCKALTQFTTNQNKGRITTMKKQIKVTLTATVAMLALAGIAQAAPAELNIYGASAEYTYWNAQAQNYATHLGCTASAPVNNGGVHGFVSATGCTSTLVPQNAANGNSRDLDIRYSGIASAEGILAVSKQAPLDATTLVSSSGGCNVANGERAMYASSSTTICKPVTVGTSDVDGASLTQSSDGQLHGPYGGGEYAPALNGVDTTGLTPYNTVVVPFGFFVNSAVTAQTCTAGLVGNYCTTNTHCNTGPSTSDGVCGAAATITNLSREEAVLIFSQGVANWSDLGAYFTAQPIVACLRHAGSGTHSTLDLAVVNSSWGSNVAQYENATASAYTPVTWFNQSSTDEIKCINGGSTANPNGSLIGAIGYADADQAIGVANTSQNVKQLKYNGFYPTRTALRNGLYDFYTNAWLWTNPANGSTINNLAADMIAFAKVPTNVPPSKVNYWATQSEMKFNKATDNSYPGAVHATAPQLP